MPRYLSGTNSSRLVQARAHAVTTFGPAAYKKKYKNSQGLRFRI